MILAKKKLFLSNNLYLITFLTFLIFSNKMAISATDAGSILKGEQELNKLKNIPRTIPNLQQKQQKKAVPKKTKSTKIFVKEFRFQGLITKFKLDYLRSIIKKYLNRENSFDEIKEAAQKIRDLYIENGFFLAKAIIPEQQVEDGIILIVVSEGRLDEKNPYQVNGSNLRLYKDLVTEYIDNALSGGLTKFGLERALLNLNDLPGIEAVSTLKRGDEKDSSKIVIEILEDELLSGNISVDNHGNRYTAKHRTSVRIDVNNPSRVGDKLSITKTSNIVSKFDYSQFDYQIPVGRSGLKANLSTSILDFQIGQELRTNPVSVGNADTYEIGVEYPIQRSNDQSIFIKTNFEKKQIYNETSGTVTNKKVVENKRFSIDYQSKDKIFSGGLTGVSFSNIFGELDLSKVTSDYLNDQNSSGPKTHGKFQKTTIDVYQLNSLTDEINFKLYGSIQFSDKNLDSSEKFSLGGISGIRAYPSGEASGDEGYKFSLELQHNISKPSQKFNLLGSIFYDYGKIKQYKDPSNISLTTKNEYDLSGWGVSFDLIYNNNVKLNFSWSKAIGTNEGKSASGNNSDGRGGSSRSWLLLTVNF